ncbi:hypothetical protein [Pseudolactococcus laudensis]|uniref:hypothetical protein n=1 Tax=Pseudolactococcus laudensis TaxID=1494461 RepID=UPI001E603032
MTAYKKELQAIYQSKQEELKQENSQLATRGLTPSADPFNEKNQSVFQMLTIKHIF